MVRLIIGLYLSIVVTFVQAQTISVSASTDTTDYLVGDYIQYNIEVVTNKNIQLLQPTFPDSLSQLELISVEEPVIIEDDNSKTINYGFILAGFDSISATIPLVVIEYRSAEDTLYKRIACDSLTVNIHTVAVSKAEEIKDVKSPILIPFDWIWLFLWIILAVIAVIVGKYLYKKYKLKKSEEPIKKRLVKIPAHVTAIKALNYLEKEQLWQKGFVKEYHSRITEIIRTYFEERFNLAAMELTTTESMLQLSNIKEAVNISDLTFNFLTNADLVKFAKFQPLESVNNEMMTQANDIVQNTIPREPARVEEQVNV